MAEAPLGSVAIDVRANLAPYRADLRGAETEANRFASVAQRGMDNVAGATDKAAKAQDGFKSAVSETNVVYVDFNRKLDEQKRTLDSLVGSLSAAKQESNQFANAQANVSTGASNAHKSITETVGSTLSLANNMKGVAAAAYVLSPALRGVVNTTVLTSLKGAGSAIAALSPAAATAAKTVGTALLPALSFIGRIGLPILGVAAAIEGVNAVIAEGARKVEELSIMYDKIAKTEFSPEFYIRTVAAAKEMRLSIEGAEGALQKFSDLTRQKFGGSALDSGFESIKGDTNISGDEKYKATIKLIEEGLSKGQRLAALDLASKIWPPEVVSRLAISSTYLSEMQAKAEKLTSYQMVDPQDVMLAAQLKDRLDRALDNFPPKMFDLTHAGLQLRSVWVAMVEQTVRFTTSTDNSISAMGRLGGVVDKMLNRFGNSEFWNWFSSGQPLPEGSMLPGEFRTGVEEAKRGLGPKINPLSIKQGQTDALAVQTAVFGDASDAAKDYDAAIKAMIATSNEFYSAEEKVVNTVKTIEEAYKKATDAIKLMVNAGKMSNAEIEAAFDKAKAIRDKAIDKAGETKKDEWDRAVAQAGKQIAIIEAEGKAVGDTAGAHAKLRTESVLRAAAERAGKKTTAELTEEISKLGDEAKEAANKLAGLKLKDDILFDSQNAMRSSTDQEIASRLRQVHGTKNYREELGSTEAAQMRYNAALKDTRAALDSIKNQTSSRQGEVNSLNLSTSAAEAYRIVWDRINEARIKGNPLGPKQIAQITAEATEYQKITEVLAKLKLQQDLLFESGQIGRSDMDQQVATRLRGIYGPGFVEQMNSAEAAIIRVNIVLNDLKNTGTELLSSFFKDFKSSIQQGATAWEAFSKAGMSALNKIADKLIDMITSNLVTKALGGAGGGLTGVLASMFGAPASPSSVQYGLVPGSTGFVGPVNPVTGHTGGMGYELGNRRYVHPAYFDDAPRLHKGRYGGLGAGEMAAVIRKEESVLTPGQLREVAGRGGRAQVTIQNFSGGEVTKKQRQDTDGNDMIEIVIGKVGERMSQGTFDPAMSRYGLKPRSKSR